MSSDAKLGLVVGLTLVLIIAQVFYRREPANGVAGNNAPMVQSTSAKTPNGPPPTSLLAPDVETTPLPAN